MRETTLLQRALPAPRALWHSLAALACTFAGTYLASVYLQGAEPHGDALAWMERVLLSIIPTAVGMLLILVSWLHGDTQRFDKPLSWVVATSALSWLSLGLAMFGYLFLTRRAHARWIAIAQFALLLLLLFQAQTLGLALSTH